LQPFSAKRGPTEKKGRGSLSVSVVTGVSFKLKEERFRSDIQKKLFTIRVMRHWHRLPREIVDAPP